MKKTVFFCGFLVCSVLIMGQTANIIVKGKIDTKDSLMVLLLGGFKVDTVFSGNGAFYFESEPSGTSREIFVVNRKTKKEFSRYFFAEEGDVVMQTDSTLSLSRPELQSIFMSFKNRMDAAQKLYASFYFIYREKKRSNQEDTLFYELEGKLKEYENQMSETFLLENTNNMVGVYVLAEYCMGHMAENNLVRLEYLYNSFDTVLRRSWVMEYVKNVIDSKKLLVHGKPVPNFSSFTFGGSRFILDSCRGKYVVIDFWGSWCPPCIAGLPKMKIYYEKYKDRIEFVNIACHETVQTWRQAVEKYKMPWSQVMEENNTHELELRYGVLHFPTKLLIDKQGRLVQIFIGETDDFYAKLDEILATK